MGDAPDDLSSVDPGPGEQQATDEYGPDEYGVETDELAEGEYEVADDEGPGESWRDDSWWDEHEDPEGSEGFGDDPGDFEEAEGDFDLECEE